MGLFAQHLLLVIDQRFGQLLHIIHCDFSDFLDSLKDLLLF